MNRRKFHRFTGILLLLPFVAWSTTAVFFLFRPAYEQAYEQLQVRQLPMAESLILLPLPEWQEMRVFRTVLGEHLLVREEGRWQHLNALTKALWPQPDNADLKRLLEDALSANPARYGRVVTLDNNVATTDTGVRITVQWNTLSLSQTGRDTDWINTIYDIHYLRWTGYRPLDDVLGVFGLLLLMYMTYSGARMAFGRRG